MSREKKRSSSLAAPVAKNLSALLIGLVLALLVAEAGVRSVPRKWVPELKPVAQAEFYLGGMARKSSNPLLYYELVPNASQWQINASGYRGPEYPLAKPQGTRRILGIGDSTLFGLGVVEVDSYLRQLEGLCSQGGERDVQVLNFGVPGYNTAQELELLRARGLAYDPDLVILGYDHNDPRPILGKIRGRMPDDYGENAIGSELIRYVRRKLYLAPHIGFRPHADGYLAGGRDWDRHFDALAEMAKVLDDRGIPIIVVVYDGWIHREEKSKSRHWRMLHEPLQSFWKTHGFHVVDCYDLFQEYMRKNDLQNVQPLWVSVEHNDAHPNPQGHRLIAEAIRETIEKSRLLDPPAP
jgi:lysophospholipase L1-like esterase